MLPSIEDSEFEQLPLLYQRWASEILPAGIPRERASTCLDCAMCSRNAVPLESDIGFYSPTTKCCTYFPDLPNFLVGRAVANDNPGGAALRSIIEDPLDKRGTATLRAVQPNAKWTTIYAHHHQEGFGRDQDLLCPFAIEKDSNTGPLCGIWQERNSVCSTWFCKHGRGNVGTRFWQALQGLFSCLEWSLSWWAISEVLCDHAAVLSLPPVKVNASNRMTLRPDAWQHWHGSKISFYEACAERVEALSAEEAVKLAGIDGLLFQTEVGTRFDALRSAEVPEQLVVAPFSVLKQSGQRSTLQSLASTEPVEAPSLLVPLLRHFDGRSTEAILEEIRVESRIRLDPALVRKLYDFGILEASIDMRPSGRSASAQNAS